MKQQTPPTSTEYVAEPVRMMAKSITRHSVVKYQDQEWVLENQGREILLCDAFQKHGISISASTYLEVVKFPAQLAFDYLQQKQAGLTE